MPDDAAGRMLTPDDLRQITEEVDNAKAREALAKQKALEEHQKRLRDEFMERDLNPDATQRLNNVVRHAAEAGQHEVMLFKFPAAFCADKGRAINNFDPDWPESLTGFARKAYDAYVADLEPLGYKMHARILNYPDGNLGDVGMFLSW